MKIELNLIKTLSFHETVPSVLFLRRFSPNVLRAKGVNVTAEFPFINAVACEISRADIQGLFIDENVSYITQQSIVTTLKETYPPQQIGVRASSARPYDLTTDTGHIANEPDVGASSARPHNYTDRPHHINSQPTIAVIDTGISPHLDFMIPRIKIRAFVDVINEKTLPYDDNGHGTFVAGVAAGSGLSSGGAIAGSAPGAEIIAIKAMNEEGEGGTVDLLSAMQWVADNRERYKISVVCMSFGCTPQKNDPLMRGAAALTNSGIAVVCASGNSGEDTVLSPAASDVVISVGAHDREEKPAKFSSRGVVGGRLKPDFYAPGVGIRGLSHTAKIWTKMTGTSVACPYVAGLCHKLRTKNPHFSPIMTKAHLFRNAKYKDGIYLL